MHDMAVQVRPAMQAVAPPPGQQAWPRAPHGPQVPGRPFPRFRPRQPSPVSQVPLLPVPQQDCPLAPQVPHWLPAVATKQASGAAHAVTPPSTG